MAKYPPLWYGSGLRRVVPRNGLVQSSSGVVNMWTVEFAVLDCGLWTVDGEYVVWTVDCGLWTECGVWTVD
ncbi:hypothetical protein SARC_07784 [Sphaeroforma arctica JP610]|uniref:Uncharacterized protein n=1 Tax=Sphaeroforma arctica JP610 TaxID=667725 RepID=A0A0L0FTE2_9EUKA|nr:hypothetical protein SARC_07784 [Sphaeroforma arctica JP610]KNC79836.1 hypothetical protein SARC_07784 [Sphaeroforma arctica JP610]|eukprot:XP_014153738.1 hypothetical protein SARC_07784 [Sphaeroforma arctica JP610]